MTKQQYEGMIRKEKEHLSYLEKRSHLHGAHRMIANSLFNVQYYQRCIERIDRQVPLPQTKPIFNLSTF